MAIFPVLEVEAKVQAEDRTRLSGVKSYLSKDEDPITLVEVEPEASAGFIDVTGSSAKDWFLDWQYGGASRTVTASIRITTSGTPVVATKQLAVLTATDDGLFSSDSDLRMHESDILRYVPDGKNSFVYVHRRSQEIILDWFDRMGYETTTGGKITKENIVDTQEVAEWSKFLVLALIFADLSNAVDDVFDQKSKHYQSKADDARNRAKVRLDLNDNDEVESGEFFNLQSLDLIRR